MTRKQIIEKITDALKEGKVICIKEYQNTLRNGRWGLHAYELVYNNGEAYCVPWHGANVMWRTRWDNLNKSDLIKILGYAVQG